MREIPEINFEAESRQLGSIAIIGCEEYEPKSQSEIGCRGRSEELASVLKQIGIFSEVIIGESKETHYFVQLRPYVRKPYYHSLGHNPGLFIISLVVPFWETFEFGYDFYIASRADLKQYRVNTLETGTQIMWSGSILLNLFPGRGIPRSFHQNESEHLKRSILLALNGP